jgi:putative ABC transport system permease protein
MLSFVILAAAFFLIANERKKEFALLRLLGTSRRQLLSLVRKETVLCSLAGGILGTGVAAVIVFPFNKMIEVMLGLPYLTPDAAAVFLTALAALFGTVLAASVASAWTARRLSRVDPGCVLRKD